MEKGVCAMRIRWNSIVTLAAILGVFVWVQLIAAYQAPAQGQRGGAAPGAAAPAAPAAGAQAAPAGQGRGGGRGGGRGAQDATPAGPVPRLPNGKPDLSGHWTNPYTPNMAGAKGANALDPKTRMPLTWDRQGEPLADSKGVMKTFDLPYTEWGRQQWAKYDPVANGDYAGSCLPFGMSRNINSPHGVQIVQNNDAIAFLWEQ